MKQKQYENLLVEMAEEKENLHRKNRQLQTQLEALESEPANNRNSK